MITKIISNLNSRSENIKFWILETNPKWSKTKLKCQCQICLDEWESSYQTLYYEKGKCLVCSGRKLTLGKVLKNLSEKFQSKYIYCLDKWKSTNTKFYIKCTDCGNISFKNYNSLYKGEFGCKNCSIKNNRYPISTIKENIQKVHPNHKFKEFIDKGNLNKSRIIMECSEHGDWKTKYSRLVNEKRGCPYCSGKKLNSVIINKYLLEFGNDNSYSWDKSQETNSDTIIEGKCPRHGSFEKKLWQMKLSSTCPKCYTNKPEEELINIFDTYKIKTDNNSRQIINPLEIDIFLPEFNFGIEHNGLIFHSYGLSKYNMLNNYKDLDKNKHLDKTILMEEKGFQLFHIREDHLLKEITKDIWKSMLLNKCGVSHKIHARKLQVINLSNNNKFVNEFLENNHLQGSGPSKVKLGLQDPKTGIVYSVMTFGISRFNKSIDWELLRFCNTKYHNVRGAASKLLKAFERTYKPASIISYANRDWSQGNLYKTLGFKFSHASEPNYIYTNEKQEIISRYQTQKHKLKNFLESRGKEFKSELSEKDNMILNDFRIFYDTGNLVYIKNY